MGEVTHRSDLVTWVVSHLELCYSKLKELNKYAYK